MVETMLGQLERGEQLAELCLAYIGATSLTFSSTERQGNSRGSWKTTPELAVSGQPHPALEVAVQSDNDAQKRCLATSRRTDQRGDLPIHQGKRDLAENVQLHAGSGAIALLFDVHIKLA